ncbi:MAG TPA: hypothetical protein VIV11_23060 [Kofleriaceae bacterium]
MIRACLVAGLLTASVASPRLVAAEPASPSAPVAAEPASPSAPVATDATSVAKPAGTTVAVAVNSPLSWFDGSFGGSVYLGFKGRHAIRGNFARYNAPSYLIGSLIEVASNGEASGPSSHRFIDASVGYMVFPRRLWSGPLLEAAVMFRRPMGFGGYGGINEYLEDTRVVAARVLVGWSWCITERMFASIAVGGSRGIEWGVERTAQALDTLMPHTRAISRTASSAEGFLRIGRVFEL